MKHLIASDKKKRSIYSKNEKKRLVLKGIVKNEFLAKKVRNKALITLSYTPGSFVQIKNRCIFTGRARAYIKEFRVSRLVFKNLANNGYFSGVRKSSW